MAEHVTPKVGGSAPPAGRSAPPAGPALALLELGSIARGMVVADATVKRAAIHLVLAQAVTPGKFLVLFSGGEEEVAQAFETGREVAGPTLLDELYLSQADEQLQPALRGELPPGPVDALGVVECYSVASALLAADRAVKHAAVRLVRMRLARGLGGKAFFVLTGDLYQLEAGIEAARSVIHGGMLASTEIIARPHADFVRTLWQS